MKLVHTNYFHGD